MRWTRWIPMARRAATVCGKSTLLLAMGSALWVSGVASQALAQDPDQALLTQARALFSPLPDAPVPEDAAARARIELGKALFFETRASTDGRLGCVSCHNPAYHGADALPLSVGVSGQVLPRNAPTVFNTHLLVAQHYGGNRASVEEQAHKAVTSALAYGNKSYEEFEQRLSRLGYESRFSQAFPGQAHPVTVQNWASAIGAFERTLLTPAPFDRYLKGDASALNDQAKKGLAKFIATGCVGCHSGVTVGGQMFQKFGITRDYWLATGSTEKTLLKGRDKGRFHDTQKPEDEWIFKVPQLRNVAMTAPYFHDGSVPQLGDAVRIMGQLQLGATLNDEEVAQIVAFLQSLTGAVPVAFATVPALPAAAFKP
jgi:cytochrome c peroxidase